MFKLLFVLVRLAKKPIKWTNIKRIIFLIKMMKTLIVTNIKKIMFRRKVLSLKLMAYLSALYQLLTHYNWWSGFFDSLILILLHHKRIRFKKESIESADGENYCIWTPKKQTCLYPDNDINKDKINKKHIWICLPGGMEAIDPAMSALYSFDTFSNSKICMFNNPGISNNMISKPLTSPTETKYVIEYIQYLQNKCNYDVSLIGFSIGSVQALRTLHAINNNQDMYSLVKNYHISVPFVRYKSFFFCFCFSTF